MKKALAAVLVFLAAIILLLPSCSGGFGSDSGDTKELGPGIFGPDTT